MFEFLRSKGDRRGEQVLFSDFKYHLQKMLKSKNLLQFNLMVRVRGRQANGKSD